jgi:acetate kinase
VANAILVLNAGSSSIKFSLFAESGAGLAPLLRGQIEGLFTAPRFEAKDADGERIGGHAWPEGTRLGHQGALEHLVGFVRAHRGGHSLRAVGHRVVHGGQDHSAPVRIDAATLAALDRLVPLAPLHQPHNLAPIRALLAARPELPQVACFDTAFHRSQPASDL